MIAPYYQASGITQYYNEALDVLKELESDSVDLLCTDPPYGIGFMGKDWDKALPDKNIWAECLRVLKAGAFAFVMSIPRADCLSRMIISLEDAGFNVGFSPIYWAYASGFPKAQHIGKAVDKRLGVEREVIGYKKSPDGRDYHIEPSAQKGQFDGTTFRCGQSLEKLEITNSTTPQAKALDGSYGGFQPKPAVEVIIVAMKPLSEKTFVDQALKNGKGITWLDDCRIPYESEGEPRKFENEQRINNPEYEINHGKSIFVGNTKSNYSDEMGKMFNSGRFPANLLVSDDVLNDGRILTSPKHKTYGNRVENQWTKNPISDCRTEPADSGSFSRYFDLDKWAKTLPFLIVPKASKSEKNKGLDMKKGATPFLPSGAFETNGGEKKHTMMKNNHPTVKPLKLMSYLITLGSRAGDIGLDPYGGSGTTAKASMELNRECIIIDNKKDYCDISIRRYSQPVMRFDK